MVNSTTCMQEKKEAEGTLSSSGMPPSGTSASGKKTSEGQPRWGTPKKAQLKITNVEKSFQLVLGEKKGGGGGTKKKTDGNPKTRSRHRVRIGDQDQQNKKKRLTTDTMGR